MNTSKGQGKVLKTRKAINMTKNSMMTLVNFLSTNDIPELATVKEEILAQYAKNEEKAQANRDLYTQAHDIVMRVVDATPRTVAEIYEACADELPEGFSKSKVQYAIRALWGNEVVKIENAKGANQYTKA